MLLPWNAMACIAVFGLALVLSMLNVLVVGGFVGRAVTLHADLETLRGRKRTQIVILFNTILCFLLMVLLVLYAGRIGWKSFGKYARSQGCDLGDY